MHELFQKSCVFCTFLNVPFLEESITKYIIIIIKIDEIFFVKQCNALYVKKLDNTKNYKGNYRRNGNIPIYFYRIFIALKYNFSDYFC